MKNSKFYNRRLRPAARKAAGFSGFPRKPEVLNEAEKAWWSLGEVRKKARRSQMYGFEDQWGDVVRDPNDGQDKTEGQYISDQGKVPLKNNVIRPIIKNIDGQFRNNTVKPVCVVRDRKESKVGEMMSIAIEYCHQINEAIEIDAASLTNLMLSGMCAQRVEYGFNPAKQNLDVWIYPTNTYRLFFNTDIEDPRAWDVRIIGEVFDMTISDIAAAFSNSKKERQAIYDIYGNGRNGTTYASTDGLQGVESKNMDFYMASRPDLCRVILVWKKESRDALFCQDMLSGEWWYSSVSDRARIDEANRLRMEEALSHGMEAEDVLLIEYEETVEQFWYYRYFTPYGHVLKEGESPYWHREHNYILNLYPLVNGKVFNFIEDFIDQQRYINRTLTMIDFIRSSSAKGLLVVDEDAFKGMSREQIVDEYVRYNGVLFVRLKPGQNVQNIVHQYNGSAAVTGDYELLNLQLKLINDISGVNSAMQGQKPTSNTPSSLYAQQVQNASLNIKGLLDSFRNFQRKRDTKVLKTIQQYYTSAKNLDLAGNDYSDESKMYDPEKVQKSDIDVTITEGSNTPVYQMVMNDFLMELFKAQAINVKQFLENSSLPFAARILESIKRDEEEIMKAQKEQRMAQLQGIPQDVISQVPQGQIPMQPAR